MHDVHGQGRHAVAGGVLDEGGGAVEAEREGVEHAGEEGLRVVGAEVRGGVGDQRERRGVGFGEAVERERGDAADDLVLGVAVDVALGHAGAQALLDLRHPLDRALEAHRAAQLLGLAAGEAGDLHRHPQQLLLEDRHAEGAAQDRLERRVRVLDRLAAGAAVQVRVHHLADDRARADDRDLDDEVVEGARLHPR